MVPPEHETCARWLEVSARVGMAALVVTFTIYAAGLLPALVPPQELARLWVLPADRYVAITGAPTGWEWIHMLGRSDCLNLLGVAFFASVTALACAAVVPTLLREGRRLQALCALLQVIVLVIAASGVV